MKMKNMEWIDLFNLVISSFYLYVAWISGIFLGCLIGLNKGKDL